MSDFKSRLLEEQTTLSERVTKLDAFLPVMTEHNVEEAQQELLKKQVVVMKEYNDILVKRIELLG